MLRHVSWRVVQGLSLGVTATAAGLSFYFIRQNSYDLSSIGAVRFARAGIAVAKIVVDYKLTMWRFSENSNDYSVAMRGAHKRSAEKLLALACANGGVFIKVGQHLAALGYLLPDEYVKTLSVLHSRAPESSLDDARKVFEEDLNIKLEDVFSNFETRPQGAASLAQVYKATLRATGEMVAVKVQHPRVKPHSLVDMASMELLLAGDAAQAGWKVSLALTVLTHGTVVLFCVGGIGPHVLCLPGFEQRILVKIVAMLFPDFHLLWLVDEMKKNLPLELDFTNEAANAERVRTMYAHLDYLKVPKIYYEYTTDRVLTMEFCNGAQINDVDYFIRHNIDRYDVCRKLGLLFSEMIFVNGLVHCDPHPGNVLINKGKDGAVSIVLLDHGLYLVLYLTLRDDFRLKYAQLWLALLKPDQNEIKATNEAIFKRIADEMGVGELYGLFACMVTNRSWKAVTGGVNKVLAGVEERDEIKAYAATLIPQISQVLESVPRPMILILKTNDLLRSIEYRLGTQNRTDAFIQMSRCCVRAVHEHALQRTHCLLSRFYLYVCLYWSLLKIFIYERYLTLAHMSYANSVTM
uniref:ABC1 atypical kinase-like domain-containing protein n=1 Tax=Ascaris lumbricoides TaxID=6252 RepID=A0A9J2PLK6_ASCLU